MVRGWNKYQNARSKKSPVEVGVQIPILTGEAAVKTYLEDLDGGKKNSQYMFKSAKWKIELESVWRLTQGRELDIADRDHVVQTREYFQARMGNGWAAALDTSLNTSGYYQDAHLILYIADHTIIKDKVAVSSKKISAPAETSVRSRSSYANGNSDNQGSQKHLG